MKYLYYPGCSLEGSAREYDLSTRALLKVMGVDLEEIEGWSCCGASAAEAISSLLSLVLPARNLALAEKQAELKDLLVPCSACYLNLKKVVEKIVKDADLLETINEALAEDKLKLKKGLPVRHLLDVLSTDIGPERFAPLVQNNLAELRIAPYYGCQCLRPYAVFDDPERPHSMEALITVTGADVFDWEMGGKCCGASHMNTKREVGLELVGAILHAAKGADAIVTVCPMCQMNLEAFQKEIARRNGESMAMTILYLPQLLGLAVGLTPKELGLNMNLAITDSFRQRMNLAA